MSTDTKAGCHNEFLIWCSILQTAVLNDDVAGELEAYEELDRVFDIYNTLPRQRPPSL